jgi:lipopolysaccharide export LptBFGC system permease protein LptF
MRILNAYITRGFLLTFAVTLLVFLFVMAIGNIFRVIDLFSRGISGILILQVFSYGIPFSLIFAIPMSVLAAVYLHFSRLASDREIVAMRACGISLWEVIRPPLIISLLLSFLCIYINCNVAPNSHYARRKVLSRLGVETPISLLDEGRFIRDFPGLTVYISKKSGNALKDIVIHQIEKGGLKRTIRAASGRVFAVTNDPGKIQVNLYQVRIEQPDEQHPENLALTRYLNAEEYPLTIDVQALVNRDIVWKKRADLTMSEIISALSQSGRLKPRDFINPDQVILLLKDPPEAGIAYIQDLFSEEAIAAFEKNDCSLAKKKRNLRLLISEFNRIISGPCIYQPEPFAQTKLSDQTIESLRDFQRGARADQLNRLLLEDIFPDQIIKITFPELFQISSSIFRTSLLVEANTRLALSFSCFAFVLLGAALGMKIHRKESSIGIAVSLLLVFIFYFFIMIADSLVNRPELYPHLIVWIPFVVSEGLGICLIQKAN